MNLLLFIIYILLVGVSSDNITSKDTNSNNVTTAIKPHKIGYGAECSPKQMENILRSKPTRDSTCPLRSNWLKVVLQESLMKLNATIIVIGCNKGDDFVSLMEAWSGNTSYDTHKYVSTLKSESRSLKRKGGCGAAKREMLMNQTLRSTKGYCIEPMPINFNILQKAMNIMKFDPSVYNIRPFAFDAFPGNSMFPNSAVVGQEDLGLGEYGEVKDMVSIEVKNVDTFMISEGIGIVDFLSIDTEGHDGRVILGMVKTLALDKIRVLEFEYHSSGPWKTMDLSMIIDLLDNFGMDCFWQGNKGNLWRLTGCIKDSGTFERRW
jgi:FkbM family methyltransferase